VKVSRFAANTYDEYMEAFQKLRSTGMTRLILDLRQNPGGYLEAATKLADEFLPAGKLIVYTQGKSRREQLMKPNLQEALKPERLLCLLMKVRHRHLKSLPGHCRTGTVQHYRTQVIRQRTRTGTNRSC
jgi:hypothetical protein